MFLGDPWRVLSHLIWHSGRIFFSAVHEPDLVTIIYRQHVFSSVGASDIILNTTFVTLLPQQSQSVHFTFLRDRVAQEVNETFSLSITGLNLNTGDYGVIRDTMNGIIVDSDGKILFC